jgi:hypothetical protein
MAADALHLTFQSLIDRGFISAAHRDKALAHPRLDELQAMPNQAKALIWLVTRDILPEEEFFHIADKLASTKMEDELRHCRGLVDDVKEGLRAIRHGLNVRALRTLLDEHLLTQEQHDLAAAETPRDQAFRSPAAALAWMRIAGMLGAEEMQALRDRVGTQGHAAALILTEADHILGEADKAIHQAAVRTFWRGVFPGPPLLWVAGFIAFIASMVWWVVVPASAPSCTSSDIRKQVGSMLFMAQMRSRSGDPLNLNRPPAEFPRVSDLKEIGHADAERSRACSATLTLGETQMPYVFTITPATAGELKRDGDSTSSGSGFMIAGADERIIRARYAHVDADGHFAQQAAPLGRAMLEKALREGVEAYNRNAPLDGGMAALQRMRSRHPWMDRRQEPETRRTREIAEVEPLGSCRELSAKHVACRVLIERNDPMLAALGRSGSSVVEGEFSFERDAAGEGWHVDDEKFAGEYRQAIQQGRVSRLVGDLKPGGGTPAP